MDKENNNVIGRLGSESNSEYGNERMRSMPEATSGNEPNASDGSGETQGVLYKNAAAIATFTAAFVATIVISIIISRMWNEDEIKLHTLDYLTRLLQTIARLAGSWAIECERTYNEYVNALH